MSHDYHGLLQALGALLLILLVQMLVAAISKARSPGAIPGKLPEQLGHESFVFRSHRTFMNSLENLPLLLGSILLAVLAGAEPFWSALLGWTHVVARLLHMLLYYAIATERNPSPRSAFYLLGLLANIGLLGLGLLALS